MKYSEIIIDSSRLFWKACYPLKEYPFYLRNLDHSKCLEFAEKRLADTKNVKNL
jgi:hypothetical protein